ncbi:nitrogen fixation protein NifX [Sulfurovum sp. zt1-1]|uniref:Nitrogen fixation protein NifX n=1 Tax=Sulfurovum zhangzhouensis TaxID=3019067 RepID=A0ABT7QVH8_9BACT|nr:nitrogen fixation protein NifX [Sulfurovum zhangzhouensis]MDM5270835.1 nitrogen fixation protein NifX [Sulfurovum zhangzhouensis]
MGESTKITVESNDTLENSMKVAFATKDLEVINAHFGGAKEFVVYNVSKDGFSLAGVIKTDTSDLAGDDKTDFKVKALEGINIMYCESIGGTAAAKVIRAGINPMKVPEPRSIKEILGELIEMINTNPPPWVKRIMNIETVEDPRLARWAID